MKLMSWLKKNLTTLAVVVPIVVILLPIGYSSARALLSIGGDDDVFLVIPPEAGTVCVRDTEYMRFHHMNLLKEVRDRVQRDGVRGTVNFATCRTCHYNRDQFCNRCHNAVNLAPDCFGCHFYPDTPPEWEER
jgi:hypothetical protein